MLRNLGIIKPSVEILFQPSGYDGMMRHIELCGRTCYKSQDRITEDSAERFVNMLKNSGHTSVLEHGAVYLQMPLDEWLEDYRVEVCPGRTHVVTLDETNTAFVTTNYRVLVERNALDLLKYLCNKPEPMHEKRITVRFSTQIAISREYNRHRVNSPSEESTRYCNYGKDKFGSKISISQPIWITDEEIAQEQWRNDDGLYVMARDFADGGAGQWLPIDTWWFVNSVCEWGYLDLLKKGWKPQQARTVLPLDTATELIHSAFLSDWLHFFELRCDKAHAHPDAFELASLTRGLFVANGFIEE